MKIYFAGSIRGGRDDAELYNTVINMLKKYGEVLTEHVGSKALSSMGEEEKNEYIYTRDVNWIKEADVVIAEVTTPSLGVGYEIAYAESLNKKIMCLFRENNERKLSAMIVGNKNLLIKIYKEINDVSLILEEFLKS